MAVIQDHMPHLTHLAPGEITLRVPIIDGCVLIGHAAIKKEWLQSISLQVEPGRVRIKREDGEPINVETVYDEDFDTGEIVASDRLLGKAVQEIGLVCLDRERHVWGTEDLEISKDHLNTLSVFAHTVSSYALRKQAQSRAQAS